MPLYREMVVELGLFGRVLLVHNARVVGVDVVKVEVAGRVEELGLLRRAQLIPEPEHVPLWSSRHFVFLEPRLLYIDVWLSLSFGS